MKHKIAYIITRSEIGGAQNHLISLLNHFGKAYDLVLITGSAGYLVDVADKLTNRPKVYVVDSIDSFNIARSVLSLNKIFKEESPDLLHAHSTMASIYGRLAARLSKVKVLYTIHGWHFANRSRLKRILQIGVELVLRPLTTYWVTVSKYDMNLGCRFKLFRSKDVECIRNGIPDIESISQRDCEIAGSGDKFRLVFIGRKSYQKNYLEPVSVLAQCDSNVYLTMYIAGAKVTDLHDQIERLGLIGRCEVFLNDPNPSPKLQNYDAMMVTSRYEGMPLSVIEGLRAGLPIVSTDVCGMNELVKPENGFLIEFGETNQMARCIEDLNKNRVMAKSLGRSSRSLFLDSFSDTEMLHAIENVYEQML